MDPQGIITASLGYAAYQINDDRINITTSSGCGDKRSLGSERMLQQIFVNLVQRSLYVLLPGGCIGITTSCNDMQSIIEFKDSGPGMAAKNVARIFDLFYD